MTMLIMTFCKRIADNSQRPSCNNHMGKLEKLYDKVLRGFSDSNIQFAELCRFLKSLGFAERIKGDHHIFTMNGVNEILNLQPKGSKAKAYQVRQVRNIILQYHLRLEGDNEEQV